MHRFLLFVENEPIQRELITVAAKRIGLRESSFCTVDDGDAACSYLRAADKKDGEKSLRAPSLIVTDMKMPGMDGIDLLGWIRRNPTFKDTPVIILGIAFRDGDEQRAKALGCDGFIPKPWGMDDWCGLIERFYNWPKQSRNPDCEKAQTGG